MNNDRIHRFEHGGITGAAIQVLEPVEWDLNRMLPEKLQLASDSIITYTHACATFNPSGRYVMVDGGFHSQEVVDALVVLGVTPDDIELVLITHGDGDHVGGLLTPEETLAFPNAQYVMSHDLWDHWHDAAAMAELSEDYRNFYQLLASAIEDRVSVLIDEDDVAKGIRHIPCPGHRHGHAMYEFQTEDTPIIHSGDALFHPIFIENPSWPDTMATDPKQEVASRRWLLERASASKALVLTGHMPFPGMGFIRRHDDAYSWFQQQAEETADAEAYCRFPATG